MNRGVAPSSEMRRAFGAAEAPAVSSVAVSSNVDMSVVARDNCVRCVMNTYRIVRFTVIAPVRHWPCASPAVDPTATQESG
jgi:hypothetical protein